MFRKVLYPTDFSDVSLHALRECVPKLFSLGAERLYLVHVVDITVVEFEAFELEEIYREKLEKLAEELRGEGPDVIPIVRLGIPSVEIADVADGEDVDLIVIPNLGESVWRVAFVGSTATNLARSIKRPVLILKYLSKNEGKFELPVDCAELFKRPLVALDFSNCSVKILSSVKAFEDLVEDGLLVHSVDYGRVEDLEHNIQIAKQNLEKSLRGIKGSFGYEVLVGAASQAIIGTAIAKRSTLVVIGKKGRSFIKDLLLGSTAERVMRDSKLPVLLIPCD